MPIDKSWIHLKNRNCSEYEAGIKKFIEKARLHVNEEGKIRCPCVRCYNGSWHKPNLVKLHCSLRGFSKTYQTWYFHGEQYGSKISDENEDEDDKAGEQDEMAPLAVRKWTEITDAQKAPMIDRLQRDPVTGEEQLVERLSSHDSTEEPISEDAAFEKVLGYRSGYKRGWDPLPKGTLKTRGSSSSFDNIQLKEKLNQCRERLSRQEDIITQQQERIGQQQERIGRQERIIDDLQAKTDKITAYLRQLVPGFSPSSSQQTQFPP